MKKGYIIGGIMAVVVVGLFLTRGTSTPDQGDEITGEQAAAYYAQENRLVVEEGSTTVLRSGGEEEPVTGETMVGVGDVVTVTEGSAVLYWFDDSISRLSAGTELTITTADYNPGNISETHVEFEVARGNVWSKVANLVDENSSFESTNGQVAAGVRGSAFNFRVTEDDVFVETTEHATFVTQWDADGNKLGSATVVAGDQARLPGRASQAFEKKFSARIENMPSEKLASQWFAFNGKRDVEDAAKIKAKNVERLERRVGALRDVEKKLVTAEGEDKARLAVAAAQLRIGELVLSMDREGTDGKDVESIAREVRAAQLALTEANLSTEDRRALLEEMSSELKLVNRVMADVLPDNERFYRAKDLIRTMSLENMDEADRDAYEERVAYARAFELHDSLLKGWTLACEQEGMIADFKVRAAQDPEFKEVLQSFVNDVKAKCGKTIEVPQLRGVKLDASAPVHDQGVGQMRKIDPPTLVIPAR